MKSEWMRNQGKGNLVGTKLCFHPIGKTIILRQLADRNNKKETFFRVR